MVVTIVQQAHGSSAHVVFLAVFRDGAVSAQLVRHVYSNRQLHGATESEQLDLAAEKMSLLHSAAVIFEAPLDCTAFFKPLFPVLTDGLVRKRSKLVSTFLLVALGHVPPLHRGDGSCNPAEEAAAVTLYADAAEVHLNEGI